MESVTPPFSSSSDEGSSRHPPNPRPEKRQRDDTSGSEDVNKRLAPPVRSGHGSADNYGGTNGFITLHEECVELKKTEHHFPDLKTFVDELNLACQARWATRHVPYHRVVALLVRWEEDDLGVAKEIEGLELMLRDTYNFEVDTFAIPSAKRGYLDLVDRIRLLLKKYDLEDNLFILYYGGHAGQDEQSQPAWVSKRHAGSSFPVSAFLHLFVEMDADALLLFDSCQAVPQAFDSKGKGIVSAITATGFEPSMIGTAAEVGPHSFTHALIQVLGVLSIPSPLSIPPPTDVLLHTLLISELRKYNLSLERHSDGSFKRDTNGCHRVEPCRRRTPIHHWLSRNKHPRHILLLPLKRVPEVGVANPPNPSPTEQKPVYDMVVPEVLVAVRLTTDSLGELDIEAWMKWVLSLPGHPTQVSIKERSVSIEGLYRSHSSLLILRMPNEVYNSLRKFKAMSLIGYVTGENQADKVNERVDKIIASSSFSVSDTPTQEQHPAPLDVYKPNFQSTENPRLCLVVDDGSGSDQDNIASLERRGNHDSHYSSRRGPISDKEEGTMFKLLQEEAEVRENDGLHFYNGLPPGREFPSPSVESPCSRWTHSEKYFASMPKPTQYPQKELPTAPVISTAAPLPTRTIDSSAFTTAVGMSSAAIGTMKVSHPQLPVHIQQRSLAGRSVSQYLSEPLVLGNRLASLPSRGMDIDAAEAAHGKRIAEELAKLEKMMPGA